MKDSSFLEVLGGYDKKSEDSTGTRFAAIHITGHTSLAELPRASTRFMQFTGSVADTLAFTSARTYGLFLIIFGALSLILHLVKDYFSQYDNLSIATLVIGIVFTVLGIPLVITDKPIASAIEGFAPTEYLFYEFFCLPVMHRRNKDIRGLSAGWAVFLATLLAVLGAVVPLGYVAVAIVGCVYVYLTMLAPEFSFYLIFIILPMFPMLEGGVFVLAAMVAVTMISFVRKVMLGKRVFPLEKYDVLLFLMVGFILISGIFVKGMESFTSSVLLAILASGYCLTSSLVTNRRLADGVVKSVIISSLPVSVIAIVETVIKILEGGLSSFDGAVATFDDSRSLGLFLLVSAALSGYFVIARRQVSRKVLYSVTLFLSLIGMVLTLEPWLFVTLLVGVLAYIIQTNRRAVGVLLGILAALPYLLLFLPSSWLMQLESMPFISMLGFDKAVAVWINSRKMFIDNFFIGVGIGRESFANEYSFYSYLENLPTSSGNFLLQIATEAGVFALISFIAICTVRLRHMSIYAPYVSNSVVEELNKTVNATVVAIMVYGMFHSFWSDMSMYYLFFAAFGLGSASLRIAKSEFDDRVAYFSDGSGVEGSTIDITIRT